MTDLSWHASLFVSTALSTVVAVTLGIAADISYRITEGEEPSRIESLEASRRSLQIAKECAAKSSEIEAKVIDLVDPSATESAQVLDKGL